MKKIFNFVIVIWLILSSVIIAKNHLGLELPSGTSIQLNMPANQSQDEVLNLILEKCKTYNIDLYKSEYLGSKDNKELYKIYYTNTSSNSVLSSLSIENGKYIDGVISTRYNKDKPYVKAFNLDTDYEFYDLKSSINDTTLEGVYKILSSDKSKTSKFISELKSENITIDIFGQGKSIRTNENVELIIFFMIIILLLSFYMMIQHQKEISIKKLNGYGNKNIVIENNMNLIKRFVIFVSLILIIDIVMLLLLNEYDSMMDYISMFCFVQFMSLMILLILHNIANLYLFKIHPVLGIKNFSKDIIIDISSTLVKIATLIMIILYLLSLSNVYSDMVEISSNVERWESTKNLAYTITQGYYPSTVEEETQFEQKFKYLYTDLNQTKSAILLDATSYSSNIPRGDVNSWSYDRSKVIVNKNYLKGSDIPNSILKEVNNYDTKDTLILIPSKFRKDEEAIKNNFFKNLPLNHKDISRIKTVIYEMDISLFTADLEVDTKGHTLQNPIIVVDDNNLEGFYYLGAFSSGVIHVPIENISKPYDEIKDSLIKSDLDHTIKITPLLYSRYSEQISEFNANIAKITLQLFLLFIVGITLIYNSIIIFITRCSKEIAIKKMIGYQKYETYINYYKDMFFVWLISGICIYLYLGHLEYIPILLLFIVFESLLTYVVITLQERKNILSMLKGNK